LFDLDYRPFGTPRLCALENAENNDIAPYQNFDTLVEKVCRCWKHGMRMAQDCFAPLIKPLLETVARAFNTSPRS
jgi:hypothetical protein